MLLKEYIKQCCDCKDFINEWIEDARQEQEYNIENGIFEDSLINRCLLISVLDDNNCIINVVKNHIFVIDTYNNETWKADDSYFKYAYNI